MKASTVLWVIFWYIVIVVGLIIITHADVHKTVTVNGQTVFDMEIV